MFDNSRHHSTFLLFTLIVIVCHMGLLGIGFFWTFAPPISPPRPKVIVQTISLKSSPSVIAQNNSSPSATSQAIASSHLTPPEEPSKPDPLPLVASAIKEDIPLKQDILPKQEERAIENVIEKEVAIVASHPLPPLPKKELTSQPKAPAPKPIQETAKIKPAKKPAPSKKPEEPVKKPAPVKKPLEAAKKSTIGETTKAKSIKELEKKQEQERIAAEKKRQKEKAEIEKKRQQEKEAEKKRQQEIAEQEVAQQRQQALLSKAKENLAKIGETRDKISSSSSSVSLETTHLPKELGNLQVDALPIGEIGSTGEWGTKEISYSQEVATRLKMALRLPDYGAVKIKLTLDRTGKVIKVETMQSESNKNKTYVESKILTLLFPSFGQRFQGVSQNTFIITLQNDS